MPSLEFAVANQVDMKRFAQLRYELQDGLV